MPPRESAPVNGWDDLPDLGDKSTSADLARVKWYRNKLAHHEDGKLCPAEYFQYWGDLESAIGRLGGPSMLKESQSAQHIVLDKSLIDMLNIIKHYEEDIHNLQVSQERHTIMINYLRTTIDHQGTLREQHEKKIQLLNVSIQKGEAEVLTLTTEVSQNKGSIEKCKETIETCKKEIDMIKVTIKGIQEKAMHTQNQVGDFTHQLYELECKYGNKFKEIGEQLATCVKEIDNIKKEQHNEDDTSGESKQKRLEDDTKALIEEHVKDGTFVTIEAVRDGLLLLKQNGVLLITGHAGTGKSRIGLHILHLCCSEEDNSYTCIKLDTLEEWENEISRKELHVILIDDLFGKTNCEYNSEKDTILDKVHAYVSKGNIKIIITIRDTVKRQCHEVFNDHRLFKFEFIDLSSDKYRLRQKEKHDILTKYMKTVRQSDYIEGKGFINCTGVTTLRYNDVWQITRLNPVIGFPLAVYQFVYNSKYFQLGSQFFDRPTETLLNEINKIRRKGEDHKKFMIQYAVMVYTALNENRMNPDCGSITSKVAKIMDAIYGIPIILKKYNISDTVDDLKGSYFVQIPNHKSYEFHHQTLLESVILSFAQIDEENVKRFIPFISWSFFLKIVRSNAYKEREGEVVLRIPIDSYKLLADRLVYIYLETFFNDMIDEQTFILSFINSEIVLQKDCRVLTYFLKALEKENDNDKDTANIIKCNAKFSCFSHLKREIMFMSNLLIIISKTEKLVDIYNFILQKFNQVFITSKSYFSIDYMKAALISSVYYICSTKDLRSVIATFDLLQEMKIPILIDQGINLTSIGVTKTLFLDYLYDYSETRCIFITLCIWKAYEAFNVSVLQYLLSKYNQTPFDVNLFFQMIYRNGNVNHWLMYSTYLDNNISEKPLISDKSLISYKSLEWTLNRFEGRELVQTDFILKAACQLQMLDTVTYLAARSCPFDAISCLKISLGVNEDQQLIDFSRCNKDLFNFLLSKIDSSSTDLTPIANLVIQQIHVPDYIFDGFFHLYLNNKEILNLACKNAHFYVLKQLIERGENLDIHKALISTCMTTEGSGNLYCIYSFCRTLNIEVEKLEIVKYIVRTHGYEKFDVKAACQQAYQSNYFKIIKWFVQNIALTKLDMYFTIKSALTAGRPEILECIMEKIDLASLDKIKVLKCVTEHFTVLCSTNILEIVSSIWESTVNKEDLKVEEIVDMAYKGKCFEILMWNHEKCNSQISFDARKLFIAASETCRVDVAKWVLENFEQASLDIDEGKLFMLACDKMLDCKSCDMIKLILLSFKVNSLDLTSGVLKLISLNMFLGFKLRDEVFSLVVDILENYLMCLSTEDIEIMINKSLEVQQYKLVDWFLEHRSFSSFDKQNILNSACTDSNLKTIAMLTEYLHSLDINETVIHACTSKPMSGIYGASYNNDYQIAGLKCLWKKIDSCSIDIHRIVGTICKEEFIRTNVMTWVLLNLPYDQYIINELLITCCKQRKSNHVKYICNTVDNEQLNLKEAFFQACRACSDYRSIQYMSHGTTFGICTKRTCYRININEGLLLVDYLFKILPDKTSNAFMVIDEIVEEKKYDLILYFLEKGYCRHIDMNSLMKQACRIEHVKLVRWILENVEQTKLDLKSAFYEACKCVESNKYKKLGMEPFSVEYKKHLHCLALIWHFIQDIDMLEIDTVLKNITEIPPEMSSNYDDLKNWLQYVNNLTSKRLCKSESATLNSGEDKNKQRQHTYDQNKKRSLFEEKPPDKSSGNHCPLALKRLRFETE